MLSDKSGQSFYVWMTSSDTAVAEIAAALDRDAEDKIRQRAEHGVQLKMRPGTLVKSAIAGGNGQSLTVAFDLPQRGDRIEYDSWVRTAKTLVYFSSACPASSVRKIQNRLQLLVSATVVP